MHQGCFLFWGDCVGAVGSLQNRGEVSPDASVPRVEEPYVRRVDF